MAEKPQNTPSSIEPTMIRKVLQQAHRDKALAAMSGCLYFSSSSTLSPGRVTVSEEYKALGLTIPQTLLLQADQIIE